MLLLFITFPFLFYYSSQSAQILFRFPRENQRSNRFGIHFFHGNVFTRSHFLNSAADERRKKVSFITCLSSVVELFIFLYHPSCILEFSARHRMCLWSHHKIIGLFLVETSKKNCILRSG